MLIGWVLGAHSGHLRTGTIKGDTLASPDENFDAWHDGQVRGDHEVVVARVDSNRAVSQVPHWVRGDVSRDIRTLTFVWHHAVVNRTISAAGDVAVVLVVASPERSDGTWASQVLPGVREFWLVVGPQVALHVRVAVVNEVHRALSAELDAVVGIIAVVGRSKVLELETSWDVDVALQRAL